ncbi:MAG: YihY/virulence factor BrkB family protein [Nocardiopsaceae bacterium]|nr:YihY/virulence factor BrkB family protein [Nocardiopsaceae bacterium]
MRATLAQAWQDRVLGLAAEAGFWALLSLTPLLLILISSISLLGRPTTLLVRAKLLHAGSRFLAPTAVNHVLAPVLDQVTQHGAGGLLSIGTLFALLSGSTAMNTYVNTITIAYGMRDMRSAVRSRIVAFVMYLGSLVVGTITLPLLIIVPGWAVAALPGPLQATAEPFLTYGYWPAVTVMCTLAIASLYHFAVPVRGRWRRDLPGAVAAMGLWLACSYGLRSYLSYAIGHSPTYGALSAPAAALLFLYVTSLALLLGAELNAQIGYARTHTERPTITMKRLESRLPEQAGYHHQQAANGRRYR